MTRWPANPNVHSRFPCPSPNRTATSRHRDVHPHPSSISLRRPYLTVASSAQLRPFSRMISPLPPLSASAAFCLPYDALNRRHDRGFKSEVSATEARNGCQRSGKSNPPRDEHLAWPAWQMATTLSRGLHGSFQVRPASPRDAGAEMGQRG